MNQRKDTRALNVDDMVPTAIQRNNFDEEPDSLQDEEEPQYNEMEECPSCSRKFNPKAYDRHVKVCKDVFVKKRKAFDSKAHRIVDDEQVQLMAKTMPSKKQSTRAVAPKKEDAPIKSKIPKWKIQSLQFRQAIGTSDTLGQTDSNFGYGKPNFSKDFQATEFVDPSIKQCPHCLRKFNEEAGTRHIPVCAKKTKENAMKAKSKAPVSGRQSTRQAQTTYGKSMTGSFKR